MKSWRAFLASLVSLNGLALAGTGGPDECDAKQFIVTTRRMDDEVKVDVIKDKAIFVVKSPFGISHAAVERRSDTWPETLIFRLHLKGLSLLQATQGNTRVDAAVGIQDGKIKVRIWKDGDENARLDEKSPLWIEIRLVGANGKPAQEIPLKDGYFEARLPKAFFKDNPQTISVRWIDFYR